VDLIRPFQRDDIPQGVELFRTAFLNNGNHAPAGLESYFDRAIFQNPWYDEALPSFVHATGDGLIDGFVGVQPKRLRLRGRRLRVAVATKLMVSPAAGPLVAARLLGRVFAGPQDLLLSDISNAAGRRIWEGLGGVTVLLYSLQWQRLVRPARHALSWLRARGVPSVITRVLHPLGSVADSVLTRWRAAPVGSALAGYSVESLPLEVMATRLPDLLGNRVLQPEYDEQWLRWILDLAQRNEPHRVLRGRLVRDASQEPAGWFLYFLESQGQAEVVQLVARRNAAAAVFQALLADASNAGAAMVSGRLEPGMVTEMSARHCYFREAGLWTLAHTKQSEILDAILAGNAFLSRLEGEW
jgi:hypothetical protein